MSNQREPFARTGYVFCLSLSRQSLLLGVCASVGLMVAACNNQVPSNDPPKTDGNQPASSEPASTLPADGQPIDPPKVEPKAKVKKPLSEKESGKIIEAGIRLALFKFTGELTKADLEKVTELYLKSNQLTSVKGLEKLTQLKVLSLDGNKLTDVKGLEKLTQLTSLGLEKNQLTDVKGLEKLTQSSYLTLRNNKLTDVKGLEKLTQLEVLYLSDNPNLTKAENAELQKALPKCEIGD